jgi:hypothetical protein
MTATNKPYCIDLYHLDAVVGANCEGFAQVKAQGIAFLDHKATQGTDSTRGPENALTTRVKKVR